jgi:hemerythrin
MGLEDKQTPFYTTVVPSPVSGLPSFDKTLDDLVTRLDSMAGASGLNADAERFSEILSQVGIQLGRLFAHEERVFGSLSMPESLALSHVKAHSEILDQYIGLNFDLMAGKSHNRLLVLQMIKGWIIRHAVSHDTYIKAYLPEPRAQNAEE